MARQWYFAGPNDEDVGPVDASEIRRRVADGTITPETMVWRDDLPDWIEAGRIRKLFPHLHGSHSKEDSSSTQRRQPTGQRQQAAQKKSSKNTFRPAKSQSRVNRTPVDEQALEDDWASLGEHDASVEEDSSDDPFAVVEEDGQAMRSFRRPAPSAPPPSDDELDEYDEVEELVTSRSRVAQSSVSVSQTAGPFRRLLAAFIDYGLIAGWFWGCSAVGDAVGGDAPNAASLVCYLAAFGGVPFLMFVLYPVLHATPWQATFGKKIAGIVVTNGDGDRIGFGHALGRELLKQTIFFMLCGLNITALVVYFTSNDRQCLHDLWCHTLVCVRD